MKRKQLENTLKNNSGAALLNGSYGIINKKANAIYFNVYIDGLSTDDPLNIDTFYNDFIINGRRLLYVGTMENIQGLKRVDVFCDLNLNPVFINHDLIKFYNLEKDFLTVYGNTYKHPVFITDDENMFSIYGVILPIIPTNQTIKAVTPILNNFYRENYLEYKWTLSGRSFQGYNY